MTFRQKKTDEAICFLLNLAQTQDKRMLESDLLQILYIADRLCLGSMGRTITQDSVVSSSEGPLLLNASRILRVPGGFKNSYRAVDDPTGPVVTPLNFGPYDELCTAEERNIERALLAYRAGFTFYFMPEWQNSQPGEAISQRQILQSIGKSEAEIEDVLKEQFSQDYLDSVLGQRE